MANGRSCSRASSNEDWTTDRDSDYSSTSLQSDVYTQYTFESQDLRPFLRIITDQIDFSAVALILYSNEVIELQTAQDLLQFSGGEREKSLKVLDIFSELKRQEGRVPFFLRSLLVSGESSPTNRELYERLSWELGFSDNDVDDACKIEVKRRSLRKQAKRRSGSATCSNADIVRKMSLPVTPTSYQKTHSRTYDNFCYSPTDSLVSSLQQENTRLQQENGKLQQEVIKLHQYLEYSFNKLTETQRDLLTAQSQLKPLQAYPKDCKPQNRRMSSTQISPSTQGRIRKISRSLDSIHHELVRLHLEQETIAEMTEPVQLPMLNHKSPSLRAKTTKSQK